MEGLCILPRDHNELIKLWRETKMSETLNTIFPEESLAKTWNMGFAGLADLALLVEGSLKVSGIEALY